jgi:hypothetical protein
MLKVPERRNEYGFYLLHALPNAFFYLVFANERRMGLSAVFNFWGQRLEGFAGIEIFHHKTTAPMGGARALISAKTISAPHFLQRIGFVIKVSACGGG